MKSWSIPKRYFSLVVYDGRASQMQQTKVLSDLDVTYKVEMTANASVSGAAQEATILIYGLKRDTMNYLSTSFTTFVSNQIRNKIEVIAGYEGQSGLIFSGDIVQAVPHLEKADYYIEIKAMSNFAKMLNDVSSYSFKGITLLGTILAKIALDYGLVFINDLASSYIVEDYSASDLTCQQHLKRLSDMLGIDIYIQYDKLFAKERFSDVALIPSFEINQSNMIGSPRPTQTGCEVDIRLNSFVLSGQKIKMATTRFPQLNASDFIIQTVSHKLDTKGDIWMTTLNLVRSFIRGA